MLQPASVYEAPRWGLLLHRSCHSTYRPTVSKNPQAAANELTRGAFVGKLPVSLSSVTDLRRHRKTDLRRIDTQIAQILHEPGVLLLFQSCHLT